MGPANCERFLRSDLDSADLVHLLDRGAAVAAWWSATHVTTCEEYQRGQQKETQLVKQK